MRAPQRSVPPPVDELPDGYRITEITRAGASTTYRLVHGSGQDQQHIGTRDRRDEATQLAFQHRNHVHAQRAAALSRPTLPTYDPGR